ncbi:expressed unknown protein [Seminavis robusta]|uniref:Uncharacterized protein n=1 Tax=Seminavis robusta TaxID=568900 RepID=A0A9N8HAW0_9STRA|nr:expressed unknown protein [Seminavis robusta]|eukprot:Sro336_g120250.1 n/a (355) ;mRNA; r:3667-5145
MNNSTSDEEKKKKKREANKKYNAEQRADPAKSVSLTERKREEKRRQRARKAAQNPMDRSARTPGRQGRNLQRQQTGRVGAPGTPSSRAQLHADFKSSFDNITNMMNDYSGRLFEYYAGALNEEENDEMSGVGPGEDVPFDEDIEPQPDEEDIDPDSMDEEEEETSATAGDDTANNLNEARASYTHQGATGANYAPPGATGVNQQPTTAGFGSGHARRDQYPLGWDSPDGVNKGGAQSFSPPTREMFDAPIEQPNSFGGPNHSQGQGNFGGRNHGQRASKKKAPMSFPGPQGTQNTASFAYGQQGANTSSMFPPFGGPSRGPAQPSQPKFAFGAATPDKGGAAGGAPRYSLDDSL